MQPLAPRLASLLLGLIVAASAAALERGEVTLGPCHLDAPGIPFRPEAFCARVEVPEDHAAAGGREIALRVAVLPAIRRDHQPDPLVLLAGGPGQAGTEAFLPMLGVLDRVRRQRDLVLVDQRGTGRLSPLDCDGTEGVTFETDPEAVERLLSACRDQIGDSADPALYTTTAAARDLDLVRERLGYDVLNVYGISYGTRLAQAYARLHPRRVRSLVLDGVLPLDLALGPRIGADAQRAVDALLERCAADEPCRRELPDLRSRLAAFLSDLERRPRTVSLTHPRTGEPVELELSRTIAAQVLRLLVYAPETAALVPLLVDRAATGDVARLAAQWLVIGEGIGASINGALSLSVTCGEDVPFFDPAEVAASAAGLLGEEFLLQLRNACRVWPHRPVPATEKAPLESDVPALLLSGEHDPVTPPAYAERVLATLARGRHLVVSGMGHGVLARGCVPRLVTDFLADPDAELDAACVDDVEPLPIFLSFTGPVAAAGEPAADSEDGP